MTVIDWLLDADPSIRWQVMRDLLTSPFPASRGAGAQPAEPRLAARRNERCTK